MYNAGQLLNSNQEWSEALGEEQEEGSKKQWVAKNGMSPVFACLLTYLKDGLVSMQGAKFFSYFLHWAIQGKQLQYAYKWEGNFPAPLQQAYIL